MLYAIKQNGTYTKANRQESYQRTYREFTRGAVWAIRLLSHGEYRTCCYPPRRPTAAHRPQTAPYADVPRRAICASRAVQRTTDISHFITGRAARRLCFIFHYPSAIPLRAHDIYLPPIRAQNAFIIIIAAIIFIQDSEETALHNRVFIYFILHRLQLYCIRIQIHATYYYMLRPFLPYFHFIYFLFLHFLRHDMLHYLSFWHLFSHFLIICMSLSDDFTLYLPVLSLITYLIVSLSLSFSAFFSSMPSRCHAALISPRPFPPVAADAPAALRHACFAAADAAPSHANRRAMMLSLRWRMRAPRATLLMPMPVAARIRARWLSSLIIFFHTFILKIVHYSHYYAITPYNSFHYAPFFFILMRRPRLPPLFMREWRDICLMMLLARCAPLPPARRGQMPPSAALRRATQLLIILMPRLMRTAHRRTRKSTRHPPPPSAMLFMPVATAQHCCRCWDEHATAAPFAGAMPSSHYAT